MSRFAGLPLALVCVGYVGLNTTAARADEDCRAARASWQPREAAQAAAEAMGWAVRRVRSDDGCYDVYATDKAGNRIEARFDPATLQIRKIEVRFAPGNSMGSFLCSDACRKPIDPKIAP